MRQDGTDAMSDDGFNQMIDDGEPQSKHVPMPYEQDQPHGTLRADKLG